MKLWNDYISEAYAKMVETVETRELGKLLSQPNEYMQRDWINTYTKLTVRKDEGGNTQDKNGSGYDLISENRLRIQSKFRSRALHLETTRRHSKKNKGAASASGHVAYSAGEADVYVFTRPNGDFLKAAAAEILAIPERALLDPKNPGFLVRNVRKSIVEKYAGKAVEVLERLEDEARAQ
jgi:hypothetical protein